MKIVVCGVGALGSNAICACRNVRANFLLIDGDRVESKNLAAQAYVKQSIGKNKAEALKLQLANFYGVQTEARGVFVTKDNVATLLEGAQLVVDAFDNAKSRRLLSAHCAHHKIPLVHGALAADGNLGIVRWDERFSADDEDVPGEASCEGEQHLPLISMVASTLARAIQDFVLHNARWDAMVTLRTVRVTSS